MKNILHAEDEKPIRDMISALLKSLELVVESAEDGTIALAKFKLKPEYYNLLITDIDMPRMNGMELAINVRQISPGLPIIFFSSNEVNLSEVPGYTLNNTIYLAKPEGFKDIKKTIIEMLGS